jgi:hypothetical protein
LAWATAVVLVVLRDELDVLALDAALGIDRVEIQTRTLGAFLDDARHGARETGHHAHAQCALR